jgi:signal transduction histidine kinase
MRTSPDARLLHEQLAVVAQRTFAETDVVVRLEQTGTERPYPPTVEAEIVGIAGEAMTNARQHSGCRTVWVTCGYGRGGLRVAVRDDGRGFDPSHSTQLGHWGLIGMRERAASINLKLTLTSAPGAGTEVVLVLPGRSDWSVLWSRLEPAGQRPFWSPD